jgi:hypothetical protein
MLRRVALVRTDISEERTASIIRVTIFFRSVLRLLVTANVVPSSPTRVTLMMEAKHSTEISVLTRFTRNDFPEDDILSTYVFLTAIRPALGHTHSPIPCVLGTISSEVR